MGEGVGNGFGNMRRRTGTSSGDRRFPRLRRVTMAWGGAVYVRSCGLKQADGWSIRTAEAMIRGQRDPPPEEP